MRDDLMVWDRVFGYGGIALAVVAYTTLFVDVGADPEVVTSVVGLAMVACMIAATVRHVGVHPGGAGRGLLVAGWVILGIFLAFAIFQAVDTAAFDEGVLDGLLSLAAAPPTLVLMVPLLLTSWAALRDGAATTTRDRDLAVHG